MAAKFSLTGHTADIWLRIRGDGLTDVFRSAVPAVRYAFGLKPPGALRRAERVSIKLSSDDAESLFVRWINEIIYLISVKRFLPARVSGISIRAGTLDAVISGRRMVPAERPEREIKGATFHGISVRRDGAEILLDL